MVTTLRTHIRSRDSRRFFGTYLAGKMLGLGLLLLAVWGVTWYFSTKAGAAVVGQAAPKLAGDDIVNPLNTMWVLVTAFLVFFMQAGFMMLEAGFARTREDVEHPARVHRRHVPVRHAVLGVRLRLHVRHREQVDRARVLLLEQRAGDVRERRGSRSSRSSCSSSRSPTRAARSLPVPWSAGPRSAATCSTASV